VDRSDEGPVRQPVQVDPEPLSEQPRGPLAPLAARNPVERVRQLLISVERRRSHQLLRIADEPRLAPGREDVPEVQIPVHDDARFCRAARPQRLRSTRGIDGRTLELLAGRKVLRDGWRAGTAVVVGRGDPHGHVLGGGVAAPGWRRGGRDLGIVQPSLPLIFA
jgi:hypothetical protein